MCLVEELYHSQCGCYSSRRVTSKCVAARCKNTLKTLSTSTPSRCKNESVISLVYDSPEYCGRCYRQKLSDIDHKQNYLRMERDRVRELNEDGIAQRKAHLAVLDSECWERVFVEDFGHCDDGAV